MVYLLDHFNPEFLILPQDKGFMRFDFWEIKEAKVKHIIENERCRSIFQRSEIINLFKTGKIQMVPVKKISLKRFDKIIIWTPGGRYFVLEATLFYGATALESSPASPHILPYVPQEPTERI